MNLIFETAISSGSNWNKKLDLLSTAVDCFFDLVENESNKITISKITFKFTLSDWNRLITEAFYITSERLVNRFRYGSYLWKPTGEYICIVFYTTPNDPKNPKIQ